MADDIQTEIQNMLDHHARWGGHDFNVAQALLWFGIIASVISSLSAGGVIPIPKIVATLIAALPGAVLLIDKTFKHSGRSAWHALY